MQIFVILFLLIVSAVYGEDVTESFSQFTDKGLLTSIDSEPSSIVDGCVNIISGEFVDSEVDLTIPGPTPIKIQRVLTNNNPHPFVRRHNPAPHWSFSHDGQISIIEDKSHHHNFLAEYKGPLGEHLLFEISKKKSQFLKAKISNHYLKRGITNSSKGVIGAQTNTRNNEFTWDIKNRCCNLTTSDGRILGFAQREKHGKREHGDRLSECYLMHEIRPDKLLIELEYKDYHEVKKLTLKNWDRQELASYRAHYDNHAKPKQITYTANDGRKVIYFYKDYKISGAGTKEEDEMKITDVLRDQAPSIHYEYDHGKRYKHEFNKWAKLTCKQLPDKRYIRIEYYDVPESKKHRKNIKKYVDSKYNRVSVIKAPLQSDGAEFAKWSFVYDITGNGERDGCTEVRDAHNCLTKYKFNTRQRLTDIIKYRSGNVAYTHERLYWGPRDSSQETDLVSRTFGAHGKPLTYCRFYHYYPDGKGNISQDCLYGNLTGTSNIPPADANGIPNMGAECFVKSFTYTNDKNNLLQSIQEGGITKQFTYESGTNLMSTCLHSTSQGIFLRHFYKYDNNGMVTEHIIDDGVGTNSQDLSGVTERKIEEIKRTDKYPFGLPKEVRELYWQDGQILQALRKVNHYDQFGRLQQQDTYNSYDELSYSENWTYNAHDKIMSYKNALGEKTAYDYDKNDNKIEEIAPNGLKKEFIYDQMNRLHCTYENHSDGVLSQHIKYDLCSNPYKTIDACGNVTITNFDEFHRPVQVIKPAIENNQNPTTNYVYDEMSNPIEITDALGNTTYFKYTLYGKPYYIQYPDKSEERFEYDLQGRLVKEIAKNGSVTVYTNDAQGRVTKKQIYDSAENLLIETQAGYNAFHLLWETDPAGNLTTYTYDGLGRKATVTKGDMVTAYTYDSLGRVASITNADTVETYEYDVLNRVIEERTETLDRTILLRKQFVYDAAGNKTKTIQDTANGPAVTEIIYDTHGIPIKTIDPEGNVTTSHLDLNYINAQGQRVMCVEVCDPLGQITQSIQDTHGNVVEVIKKNPFGAIIQHIYNTYNAENKCIKTLHKVYAGNTVKDQITLFKYDAMQRLISLVQAAGTPDEKTTTTHYNAFGQKDVYTKPNGISILYTYDALGRMQEMRSTDQTVHYRFNYDLNSNPTLIENLIDQTATTRSYDIFNHITSETLETGLTTQMTYNLTGNLELLTLPDQSFVRYAYEGPLLKTIERFNPSGNLQYTHTYDEYDLSGYLLSGSLINNLGAYHMTYTLKGEHKTIEAPHFSETLTYDAVGNLTSNGTQTYTYDALYQLTKENDHTYAYDSLYNRISKDNNTYTLNSLNHLLSDGEIAYTYDLCGNLISNGTQTFTYDALDRLTAIDNITYRYDSQNRLITRTENSQSQHLMYIAQNEIGSTDSNLNIQTLRILGTGLGAEIGATIAIEIDGTTYAPLHDHIGNITTLLAPDGTAAETYNYTAYGEESQTSQIGNPWRFSSKRKEGAFILYGNRFYNPTTGRWLTPDPIGYDGGPNLYAYVQNNPLTHFDSYGNFYEHSSFWNQSWDQFQTTSKYSYNTFCDATKFLGGGVKQLTHHTVPFPVVKDVGCFAGHFMQEGTYKGYVPSWQQDRSQYIADTSKPLWMDRAVIIYHPGMNTTLERAYEGAQSISNAFGGSRVDIAYTANYGTGGNLICVGLNKLGFETSNTRAATIGLKRTMKEVNSQYENAMFINIGFSQGCQNMYNATKYLTPEEKRQTYNCCLGPARIHVNTGVRMERNYISNGDPITAIADCPRYAGARMGKLPNVHFLEPLENTWFDHNFPNKTYGRALEYFRDELLNRMGN